MSKPQIVVRVDKHGDHKGHVTGVYADISDMQCVDRNGHSNYDDGWYRSTRPATAEEEQEFTAWYEPNYGLCELVKRRNRTA